MNGYITKGAICPLDNGGGIAVLLEDLLGEHGEIDTPVAPDVTAIGLYILVLVTLAVPVSAQVDGALIEEVGATHTHPVELGLAAKELSTLLSEVRIGLDLIGKRLVEATITQVKTCREESEVVELVGVEQTYVEGVTTTHGQTADGTMRTILQCAIVGIDIVHDIHEALGNGSHSGILRTGTAIAETWGVHTP